LPQIFQNTLQINSLTRYIFPGGVLPSLGQISRAVEKKVIIEDVHNFGPDYDKTTFGVAQEHQQALE